MPVTRDGRLVGIVSRRNLLQALASPPCPSPPVTADDRAIRAAFHAELRQQAWAGGPGSINAVVADGVVHLWGIAADEALRQAIVVAAESIPVSGRWRITWITRAPSTRWTVRTGRARRGPDNSGCAGASRPSAAVERRAGSGIDRRLADEEAEDLADGISFQTQPVPVAVELAVLLFGERLLAAGFLLASPWRRCRRSSA